MTGKENRNRFSSMNKCKYVWLYGLYVCTYTRMYIWTYLYIKGYVMRVTHVKHIMYVCMHEWLRWIKKIPP